jgi:hypothetical protein
MVILGGGAGSYERDTPVARGVHVHKEASERELLALPEFYLAHKKAPLPRALSQGRDTLHSCGSSYTAHFRAREEEIPCSHELFRWCTVGECT